MLGNVLGNSPRNSWIELSNQPAVHPSSLIIMILPEPAVAPVVF